MLSETLAVALANLPKVFLDELDNLLSVRPSRAQRRAMRYNKPQFQHIKAPPSPLVLALVARI
jgi:hypothetical protein